MHYLLLLTFAVAPSFGMGKWLRDNKPNIKNGEIRALMYGVGFPNGAAKRPVDLTKALASGARKASDQEVKRSLTNAIVFPQQVNRHLP